MLKRYPFKFLNAYTREDAPFFFGRQEEIDSLYQMLFQARIAVVYGTSGTGKTSLIQCGLASKFQSYDWLALYVRRGHNLIAALDKVLCEASDGAFSREIQQAPVIRQLAQKVEAVYRASFKPIYLIFDQFEELFVLGDKFEQALFIQTIQEILQLDQPVKMIISIREEYLGYLYDFERAIPSLMRKKLRVEPMNREKVIEVIENVGKQPEGNVRLYPGQEREIAGLIFDKIHEHEKSLSIPLPYLQVFLDKFYLHVTQDESHIAEAMFSLEALAEMGQIEDVLSEFLEDRVKQVAQKMELSVEAVWSMLSPFATSEGTKKPLHTQEFLEIRSDTSAQILSEVLRAFSEARILRFTEHDQRYELMHDSLAQPIAAKRSEEEIALMEIQRLIKSEVALNIETRDYFSEKQLAMIEPYLNRYKPNPAEQEWIDKSKAHYALLRTQEESRRQEELEKAQRQRELEIKLHEAEEKDRLRVNAENALIEAQKQRNEAERQKSIAERNAKSMRSFAVSAFVFAFLAFGTGLWAVLSQQSVKEALEAAQKAENQKLSAEIEAAQGRLLSFQLNGAAEDLITYEQAIIDSLTQKRDTIPH